MLKILIIGSGFIGRHLADTLVQNKNILLTVFGRNSIENNEKKIDFIRGDFSNTRLLKKALSGQDIVYHFVSHTIPSSSWDNPIIEVEKNLIPSLKLIEIAAVENIKKICFASSGGTIYGFQQKRLTEESCTEPFSPYGITKRTIESFLQYAKLKHCINYDIYRISNLYGEGQNIEKGLGFINTTLQNIINNRPVIIYGDGENVRDYVYVKDAVNLLTLSIFKEENDSDIYNISSNYQISLNNLINIIKNITGVDFEVKYLPPRLSDNRKVILDNSKIMKFFSKFDFCSLESGIEKTYEYLKKENKKFIKKATSLYN